MKVDMSLNKENKSNFQEYNYSWKTQICKYHGSFAHKWRLSTVFYFQLNPPYNMARYISLLNPLPTHQWNEEYADYILWRRVRYFLIRKSSPIAWETWVQSQVESYQRLKKWYLMLPCLALSIIRYGSRVK